MTSNRYSLQKQKNSDDRLSSKGARWYKPKVDPQEIRVLMQKSDARAFKDTIIWFLGLGISGYLAVLLWPSVWSIPFWFIYGVLYGSASDSRWHECGHRTAFKTEWMNNVVYHIASFMLIRNPVVWKASHVRHHTDTIIVGRDPEIVAMRPLIFAHRTEPFGPYRYFDLLKRMALHVTGRLHSDEVTFLRSEDHPRVFRVARIWLLIYLITALIALWLQTILPFMLIGLPVFTGHGIM